jgi:hypothetical protein
MKRGNIGNMFDFVREKVNVRSHVRLKWNALVMFLRIYNILIQ